MALKGLEETINTTLDEMAMTKEGFFKKVGMSRSSMWRRWSVPPWNRSRRKWTEQELFTRMANVLEVPCEWLMWAGGFNPFAAMALTATELRSLYSLLRIIVDLGLRGKLTRDDMRHRIDEVLDAFKWRSA